MSFSPKTKLPQWARILGYVLLFGAGPLVGYSAGEHNYPPCGDVYQLQADLRTVWDLSFTGGKPDNRHLRMYNDIDDFFTCEINRNAGNHYKKPKRVYQEAVRVGPDNYQRNGPVLNQTPRYGDYPLGKGRDNDNHPSTGTAIGRPLRRGQ